MAMRHLREIAVSEIDADMRRHIERTARQCRCNFTVLEGLVTHEILIVMHQSSKPSAALIEKHERQQFYALPVGSEKQ
jgi:hypothetical protein